MEKMLRAHVYAIPSTEAAEGYTLKIVNADHKYWMGDETIDLGEQDCYFDAPQVNKKDLAQKAIDTLRDKQKKARAEAYKESQRLEGIIQGLLRLEYISEEPDPNFKQEDQFSDIPF